MKRIVHYVKITTLLHNYWYFIVATWLGFQLDQLKANFHKLGGIIFMYRGIPYYYMIYIC